MTERERSDLCGAVQSCRLERTWYSFRCGSEACEKEEHRDASLTEFRRDGALLWRKHNNPDGSEYVERREYSVDGRLLAVHSAGSDGQNWRFAYNYNAAGRLARIVAHDSHGRQQVRESFSYDAAGRKTKTLHVDRQAEKPDTAYYWGAEGVEGCYTAQGTATVITVYDEHEKPRELVFRNEEGELLSRVDFLYDEAGRLIAEAQRNEEQALPAEMMQKLTGEELDQVRRFFGAGEEPNGRTYRYDDRGCRVETVSRMGGLLMDRQTAVFNEHGHKIAVATEPGELASGSGSEARFRYEYDDHGNWVEKVTECRGSGQSEFSVTSIETRTLTYFDIT